MNLAFAGVRHSHILDLYAMAEKHDEVNIVGAFEEYDEARIAAEKSHGVSFTYKSYDEVLNDASVDAIAVGDYYGRRGKMIIRALEHGKHVICDKPICTDLADLDIIEKLAKEKNLKVICMLDLRYVKSATKAKELIANGTLGKVNIISFTGQHCLNYGTRPGWYFEEGKHGGTINDIAIHGIDLIRYMTGKNLTKVNYARTWNAFATKEPNFKDCGQFAAEMEDIAISADVSYAAPAFKDGVLPTYWDFYIWGEKAMINFNLRDDVLHLYTDKKEDIIPDEIGTNWMNDFVDELKNKKTLLDMNDTIKSQRQVLEIQKASEK